MQPGRTSAGTRATALTRRQHLILGLVLLAALGLRLGHWWGQARNNPFFYHPTMDELKHHEWAQSIAAGQGLPGPFAGRPFFRAPLYYYLLAGLYAAVGPNLALARLAGCMLGAATCYLLARLGVLLAGFRAGLLAGAIAAVYWPLIVFDTQLLTVGLEVFLNVLLMLVLLRAASVRSWWLFLAGGVIWGLACLARPNMLAFALGIVAWLWLTRERGRVPPASGQRSAAARGGRPLWTAALIFVGAGLTILPVTIRNRIVGGEWVLIASSGGVNFYIGNNPRSDGVAAIVPGTRADWDGGYEDTHRIPERELGRTLTEGEVSDYWYRQAWKWIRAAPWAWLRLLWLKFRLTWSPVELYNNQPTRFFARMSELSVLYWVGFPLVASLGVAGLALLGGRWRGWSLPLLFAASYLGTVVAFFTSDRYRLPFVPVLILLAAFGLVRATELWRQRGWRTLAGYLVAGGLTAVFLATNPPDREMYWREEQGQAHHHLGFHYAQLAAAQPECRQQAVDHLLETVRLRPADTLMRISVATLLQQVGRADLAEQQLAEVVARDPSSPLARRHYGHFLAQAGRLSEAVDQYRALVELDPNSAGAHAELGVLLARLKRYEEGAAQLQTAIDLGSQALDVRLQLALILAARGDYAGALLHFDAILAREPRHLPTLHNAAAALGRLGRLEEAAQRYRQVLAIDPNDEQAVKALEYTQRRLSEARSHGGGQPDSQP